MKPMPCCRGHSAIPGDMSILKRCNQLTLNKYFTFTVCCSRFVGSNMPKIKLLLQACYFENQSTMTLKTTLYHLFPSVCGLFYIS